MLGQQSRSWLRRRTSLPSLADLITYVRSSLFFVWWSCHYWIKTSTCMKYTVSCKLLIHEMIWCQHSEMADALIANHALPYRPAYVSLLTRRLSIYPSTQSIAISSVSLHWIQEWHFTSLSRTGVRRPRKIFNIWCIILLQATICLCFHTLD